MSVSYSPSVNIIRDADRKIDYIATANANRIASQIFNDFKSGIHSFTLIGSYGTGKSSFLWALEQTLFNKEAYFDVSKFSKVSFINIVGEYNSIPGSIGKILGTNKTDAEFILDAIYQEYEKVKGNSELLVIVLDEFGKFLEYAAKTNPESEIYFLQQLAEFANHPNRNILLITTLHQSFEAYSIDLSTTQKNEWNKVKGRFKELTFNEPIEQLLQIASNHFDDIKNTKIKEAQIIGNLIKKSRLFSADTGYVKNLSKKIFPLDLISAYILTKALQRYGQNERSLFSFLASSEIEKFTDKTGDGFFNLTDVFNYIHYHFYDFLNTKHNPDSIQWIAIKTAKERVESSIEKNTKSSIQLVEIIGLFNIFCSKGASINKELLRAYAKYGLGVKNPDLLIDQLEQHKIIRFSKFNDSYKLFDGTDLDIEAALINAGGKVDQITDVVSALNKHFQFPFYTAKSVTYKKGTPRLFEFEISEEPIEKTPKDEIDGYVVLIFNEKLDLKDVVKSSKNLNEAIVYGYYKDSAKIKGILFEIEKTDKVIQENTDDLVATRELRNIRDNYQRLLSHHVIYGLFNNKVEWIFDGEKVEIKSKRDFNELLSNVSDEIYDKTPVYKNELVNKHRIAPAIHAPRKNLFQHLVANWHHAQLGFSDDKFPAEKTIYISLLKENGLHRQVNDKYLLSAPFENSSFYPIWAVCESFLQDSKQDKKNLQDLFNLVCQKPYKLKLGLAEFWIPIFLFIRRDDYALYGESGYIPEVNDAHLTLIFKNPNQYWVKAFEVEGVKLDLFNKYRELLQLDKKEHISNSGFIESIKPFLIFHKQLPEYSQKTNRLTKEALAIRDSIVKSEDPEKAFFEEFPKAFGFNIKDLLPDKALKNYISKLKEAIKELRTAYDELINRVERFIQDEILGEVIQFPAYQNELIHQTSHLKEHLLLDHHKSFLFRLQTKTEDRKLWISSLAHSLLKKPLDKITDQEELILYDKLGTMMLEIGNLVELAKKAKDKDEAIKIDITTKDAGLSQNVVIVPKGKVRQLKRLEEMVRKNLSDDVTLNIAILTRLLKDQLGND